MKEFQKFKWLVLLALLVILSLFFSQLSHERQPFQDIKKPEAEAFQVIPFVGEVITFEIKKLLKVGEATLTFHGHVKKDNQDLILITFLAKALNFVDEEHIYVDRQTFLPIIVERNLNLWGRRERIIENYNQEKGTVNIVKYVGKKKEQQTLKREGPIENIYGFIYRYRLQGTFGEGETISIQLPTKQVEMKLEGSTEVKAADKTFEAHLMRSEPKQYEIWFSQSSAKIPLRIDGSVGVGKTAMIMTGRSLQMK